MTYYQLRMDSVGDPRPNFATLNETNIRKFFTNDQVLQMQDGKPVMKGSTRFAIISSEVHQ